MKKINFEGSHVALVTPFGKDGKIDEGAFAALVGRQLRAKTAGLVPVGSTGESSALSAEEHARLISLSVRQAKGKKLVIAGVASNVTERAAELAREASDLGADALLVLAPYYNKPTQDGLYRHFLEVANATSLPILVYNIPGRTGVNVLPQTLARLARACPQIAGVKEASGSVEQSSDAALLCPRSFVILSGDDSLTVPLISVGASGVISVLANVIPNETAELCRLALSGRREQALAMHLKMLPLVRALFAQTNPIPVKAALAMMGLCRQDLRLPLTSLSAEFKPALRAALKSFDLL